MKQADVEVIEDRSCDNCEFSERKIKYAPCCYCSDEDAWKQKVKVTVNKPVGNTSLYANTAGTDKLKYAVKCNRCGYNLHESEVDRIHHNFRCPSCNQYIKG